MVESVAQAVGHGPLGEQGGPTPADVDEDRRRSHDVQVRVLLAGEGGRREVLCRRAGPDRVGRVLAELRTTERVIASARSSGMAISSIVRRISALSVPIASPSSGLRRDSRSIRSSTYGRFRHDPPEGLRRHAEAGRHADAFDPRELPQVRALATNDCDLRPVDLLETPARRFPSAHLPLQTLRVCLVPPSIVPAGPWPGLHCQHVIGPCGKPPTLRVS